MYRVWHVDKYKITFKLVITHWTNEILQHILVFSGLSRPGIIDARARHPAPGTRHPAVARRLRNTDLEGVLMFSLWSYLNTILSPKIK